VYLQYLCSIKQYFGVVLKILARIISHSNKRSSSLHRGGQNFGAMHIQKLITFCVSIGICLWEISASNEESLDHGIVATDAVLKAITERWHIHEYPKFLNSVSMPHSSWLTMRVKFEEKILKGMLKKEEVKFVASFLGSSVTAGHDTDFNITFTENLGRRMEPALAAMGIKLVSRNAALGNNPCVPYDICVTPFAGLDADVVHWEQSFNCGPDPNKMHAFEHFIRESLNLPNKPIVIFADSWQPNWNEDDCKDKKPVVIHDDDKKRLGFVDTTPVEIVATMNRHMGGLGGMANLIDKYKAAGIQIWVHGEYKDYMCHGPYIPTWGCCSASWHPSKEGHALRADHTVYFWLLNFKEALNTLKEKLKDGRSVETVLEEVQKHIHGEAKYKPTDPIVATKYSDNLRCFTSFQPRIEDSRSLEALMVPSGDGKPGFQIEIFENFGDKGIVPKAKSRGYKDFKYVIYGNKDSGSLSLKIDIVTSGTAFVCEPPGNWGKYYAGFDHFWNPDLKTEMYLTKDVKDTKDFVFKKETAEKVTFVQTETKDSQSWLCVDIEGLPIGSHVLTIVPTTDNNIAFSYLMLP
jgi:hypothetical protein